MYVEIRHRDKTRTEWFRKKTEITDFIEKVKGFKMHIARRDHRWIREIMD